MIPKPQTEQELLSRVQALAGMSIGQCAIQFGLVVPKRLNHHKGWFGHLIEKVLGADAGSRPVPDFSALDIELKTLPIGANGKPCESTFVASIALMGIGQETWSTSTVKKKLSRVLWLPMEGDRATPLSQRRIGLGFLWQPSSAEEAILQNDWQELTDLIVMGTLQEIDARLGSALQIRPKAANGKSLTTAIDEAGQRIQTLPRGFYLRSRFTSKLLLSQ